MASSREQAPLHASGHLKQDEAAELEARLAKELRVLHGAENLLHVFAQDEAGPGGDESAGNEELRRQVQGELEGANARIEAIQRQLDFVNQQAGLWRTAGPPISRINSHNTSSSSLAGYSSADGGLPEGVLDDITRLTALEGLAQIRCMQTVGDALLQYPEIAERVPVEDIIQFILPLLSDTAPKDARSSAHWLVRLLCQTPEDVQTLQAHNLDWLLIKTLARDHKHDLEKQQALLTVRHFLHLTHTTSISLVSVGLLRAVVALAENGEDRLRFGALETLMELVVRDIELLAAADGIRVLLQSMNDGPFELASSIAATFLFLIDRPHLREYLRPGLDLEIALTGLTEGTGKHSSDERIKSSGRLAILLLKSWSGFFYLLQGNRQALKSVVGALSAPSLAVVEVALDTFFKLFSLETADWYSSFVSGKRLTLFRREAIGDDAKIKTARTKSEQGRASMVDQHTAILLACFVEVGLGEALVNLTERNLSPAINRKASILMGEILRLSRRLLPQRRSAQMQALPRLFGLVVDFDDPSQRSKASSTLQSVHSIHRNESRLLSNETAGEKRQLSSVEDAGNRTRSQVDSSKIRLGMQIDDASFRNLLLESHVLTAKEHSKWNFDALTELIEGPLLNPKRLEEAAKGSKFLRRITSFFHPLERRYSDLKPNILNIKYTKFACALIVTLLGTADGVRFLKEDKLFQQMADCLAQLDATPGSLQIGENLFTAARIKHTLTAGYFEMIGVCTKYEEGARLLEHFKIFTMIYHVTDLRSRDDITTAFIHAADYTLDGHPRIILSKAMTSHSNLVRLAATKHVSTLIRASDRPQEWLIKLLVCQLYDVSANVRDETVRILESVCVSLEVLEFVVQMRPSMDHLGYSGAPLLFRFLSTPIGVQYLRDIEYIDRGLDEWFAAKERNEFYVLQVELHLAKLFELENERSEGDPYLPAEAPLHFYGELVKTEEGRIILEDKGHFSDFCDFLRANGLEDQNLDTIARLKSVLWAIGNIGSTVGGLPFLEAEEIVPAIVEVAERSQCFSVRGTCIFVMGLIASTNQGAELLEEFGWECAVNSLQDSAGICIPADLGESLLVETWTYRAPAMLRPPIPPNPTGQSQQRIIAGLLALGNHMVATAASKVLAKLKATEPELFEAPAFVFRAFFLLDNYHYRLPVRKYIFELFGIPFTPATLQKIREAGRLLNAEDERLDGQPSVQPGQDSILKSGTLNDADHFTKSKVDSTKVFLAPNVCLKGFLVDLEGRKA